MSEISCSVQFAKHGKKLLTVQSIQFVHVDVAGSYSLTWNDDDVKGVDWKMRVGDVGESCFNTWHFIGQ
jgi:hypothetical protein